MTRDRRAPGIVAGTLVLIALGGVDRPSPERAPRRVAAKGAVQEAESMFPGGYRLGLGVIRAVHRGAVESDVLVNDASDIGEPGGCSIQSEVSVAALGKRVYVAYNDAGECLEVTGTSSFLGFARSADGGRTFEEVGPVPPGSGLTPGSDPVVVVDSTGPGAGTVFVASLAERSDGRSTVAVARSADEGASFTWADAAPAGRSSGFQDKEWLAIDNTGGPRDGALYLVWVDFGNNRDILFASSADDGRTWTAPRRLGFEGRGPRVAVGPDGEVHVIWESSHAGGPALFWTRSVNGGASFTLPRLAVSTTRTGADRCGQQALNGDIRTQEFPSIAIDRYGSSEPSAPDHNPHRGTLYVAYSGAAAGDESDVFLARIRQGDAGWKDGVRVNDDDTRTDQFFPEVAVTGPGTIAVSWTDRREDPDANLLMRQYLALSADGGGSFSPNVPSSDVPFPPPYSDDQPIRRVASCYAGDYNALISDRPGRLLAAWSDNRDGIEISQGGLVIPDPNVYLRAIELSG